MIPAMMAGIKYDLIFTEKPCTSYRLKNPIKDTYTNVIVRINIKRTF
jgi:hypothetical protein